MFAQIQINNLDKTLVKLFPNFTGIPFNYTHTNCLLTVCMWQRSDKMTAFHMACEQGSMPIVEYLVSKDPAICRITLLDHRGKTPLHLAAGKNHTHIVEFLLEKVSVKKTYIPALTGSLLVHPMQGKNLCSGIQEIFGFGIRNTSQGTRNPNNYSNPESKFHWKRIGIQYLESGIHAVESRIQALAWGEAFRLLIFSAIMA